MTSKTYKISSLGWLCEKVNERWVPLFKLSPEQLNATKG
jgi:hypothetical protein